MNGEIKVVENTGSWSNNLFGNKGTVLKITNGIFIDLNGFEWDKDNEPFEDIEEINNYFSEKDQWQTQFELVTETEEPAK